MKKIIIIMSIMAICIGVFGQNMKPIYVFKRTAEYDSSYQAKHPTTIASILANIRNGIVIDNQGVVKYKVDGAWTNLLDENDAPRFQKANFIDTFNFSSVKLLNGDSTTLFLPTTGKNQRIIDKINICYTHATAPYTATGNDSIIIYAKYKSAKTKLVYIDNSYITDAYSGYGSFVPTIGKIDKNSIFWIKIPNQYTTGGGNLQIITESHIVTFSN